jgi:eukaryotic-like serine/threonine-protein kinase
VGRSEHSPEEAEQGPVDSADLAGDLRHATDAEAPTLAGELVSSDPRQSGSRPHPENELAPGEMLDGHYRVVRRIGGGGMGSVYEVEHVDLGKRFAAKVVLALREDDEGAMLRLRNEARTLSSLDHENIVGVTHLGRTQHGRLFVIMDLLQGMDLAARLRQQRHVARREGGDPWLSNSEVDLVVRQTLAALAAAHQADVVHRDLKPENLFLAKKRTGMAVKVVDFGISKIQREREDLTLTRPGQILGTPLYMAPEQARATAQVDGRADLYSLGCILYEMVSGRTPFDDSANAYDCVVMHATRAPDPPSQNRPGLPAALDAFILRALEKDPADRFASADDMLAAWEDVCIEAGIGGPGEGMDALRTTTSGTRLRAPGAIPPAAPRRRWVPAMAAVAVVAAIGGWWLASPGAGETAQGDEALVQEAPVAEQAPEPEPVAALPTPEEADEVSDEAEADEVPEEPPPPEVLRKRVVSVPTGAEVWVDGDKVGTTPLTVEVTAETARTLRLTRRGFDGVERELSADDPEEVQVRLRRSRRGVLPLAPR